MEGVLIAAGFSWPNFLGPFHVVMLHYPIGFLTLAVVLELWAIRRPSDAARQVVGLVLGLTVWVSWLAVVLGFLQGLHGEFDPRVLLIHKLSGLAVATLATVTWLLHRRLYPNPDRLALRRTYHGLLLLSLGFLMVAGHQGGSLTHGSKFLTAGAPHSVSGLIGHAEAASSASVNVGTLVHDPYLEHIQPVLERKCYSCHGEEKQKGHLRLDVRESALATNEDGKTAIVPGDPMRSEAVRLILLPREDEDAMPPEGKEPLTPEETLAVVHWIQGGAPFGGVPTPAK